MAVSVDRVYQKVLALANKEQRGYITPQEFNLFADQAQMEIFEQYFYNIEQFERRTEDTSEFVKRKIELFRDTIYYTGGAPGQVQPLPDSVYLIESVFFTHPKGVQVAASKVEGGQGNWSVEFPFITSPLLSPKESRPVYWITESGISFRPKQHKSYPYTGAGYSVNYIRKPISPKWTYVIHNQNALYASNAPDQQDFQLHTSEENSLVIKILQLAGVAIKDFNLSQIAGQKEVNTIQQEKQ